MLRVGVTIKQIENKHLQNWLIFRVWIIWGGTKQIWGSTAPECPHVATGLIVTSRSRIHKREQQTEECIWKIEGKWFYKKLLDKYKIANLRSIFLDIEQHPEKLTEYKRNAAI